MHNVSCFILFCRITYDPFRSVEINTATLYKLGFTFVWRCTIVKNTFAKERCFSDNLIFRMNFNQRVMWLLCKPHHGLRTVSLKI